MGRMGRDDGSVPGQATIKTNGSAKGAPSKVIDEITIKVAENKGVTVTVRERYKDDQDRRSGEVFPFSEPKTFVYPSWDEAAPVIGGMVASGSVNGSAPPAAEPPPAQNTMGSLTNADLDKAVAGMAVGSERPDTYRSMRSGPPPQ